MEIKVLTFNIHHGKGTDGKLDLNRIAEVIDESGADFIGLNEVDIRFSKRSENMNQLSWLSEQLKLNEAFGTAVTLRSKDGSFLRQYGNALLSRYPINVHINHPFHSFKRIFEGRSLLEAEVKIHEQWIKIYITHLSLTPWKRKKQIDFIIKEVEQTNLPVILMGDLNMRPGTKTWSKISNTLNDVCQSAGSAPCHTFPSMRPKIQLDYIFVSEHFHTSSVEVIDKHPLASDHRPIKATLKLNNAVLDQRS